MKKQTSLHIPAPCHEDWNQMLPAEKGRFCTQCSRQVTDFTLMTDSQILTYLSTHAGRMCGRFAESQLNRPLTEVKPPPKQSWYLALSLPFLLLFQKGVAQPKQRITGAPLLYVEEKRTLLGDTLLPVSITPTASDTITVQGTVNNEKGAPIYGASIMQKATGRGAVSDSAGRFSLQLPAGDSNITLVISGLGYASAEQVVHAGDTTTPLNLSLSLQPVMAGEVVTVGMFRPARPRRVKNQATATCKKVTGIEKADSALQKITGSALFTVYPNPVVAGNEVKLHIKTRGEYELQLLNNNSAPLATKMINASGDGDITSFAIPAPLATGIYYLRLTGENGRKSYLQKLIIR